MDDVLAATSPDRRGYVLARDALLDVCVEPNLRTEISITGLYHAITALDEGIRRDKLDPPVPEALAEIITRIAEDIKAAEAAEPDEFSEGYRQRRGAEALAAYREAARLAVVAVIDSGFRNYSAT